MKNIIKAFTIFCLSSLTNAQVSTFVDDLIYPKSIEVFNNFLYLTQGNGSVVKLDLNDTDPVPELVLDNMQELAGLAVYNNYLLIAEWGITGETGGKIYRMNFNNEGSIEQIAENLNNPNRLKIYNNYLYFSESNGYKISRIDLSNSSSEVENIISNGNLVHPYGIEIYDNYIYYLESEIINGIQLWRLKRQNLNNFNDFPQLILDTSDSILSHPIGLLVVGNQMLICDNELDAIFKLNLIETNQIELLVENVNGVLDCIYIDGNLYMVETLDNEISVLMNLNLAIENISTLDQISIYPNPTYDYIYFPNSCYNMSYKIFDLNGNFINYGRINSQGLLDLSVIPSGVYFIKLENQIVKKFIKK